MTRLVFAILIALAVALILCWVVNVNSSAQLVGCSVGYRLHELRIIHVVVNGEQRIIVIKPQEKTDADSTRRQTDSEVLPVKQ